MRRSGVRSPSAPPRPSHPLNHSIQVVQAVHAPPARVWRACASTEGLQNWQADEVRGRVRPGEQLRLRWPALGAEIELGVGSVEEGRRVTLQAAGSTVEMAITPGTVTVAQDGLAAGDESDGVASSWRLSLALLAHHLEHHAGRTRQVSWFFKSMRTSSDAAHVFFTEPAALSSWLTRAGELDLRGGHAELVFNWGEQLSGQVLAHTPGRDLAISWQQQDNSVLVLRTLPSPLVSNERLVAAVWSCWSDCAGSTRTRDGLGMAMGRLARILSTTGEA
jgi:uncharacterized protein YndB with AHSA1/START domain